MRLTRNERIRFDRHIQQRREYREYLEKVEVTLNEQTGADKQHPRLYALLLVDRSTGLVELNGEMGRYADVARSCKTWNDFHGRTEAVIVPLKYEIDL